MKKLASGVGLLSVSAFMLLGFVRADLSDQPWAVRLLTFGIGVGLPTAGGVGLVQSHRHDRNRRSANHSQLQLRTLQSETLKLAATKQGKLTEIEVISELGLDAAVAHQVLTSLCHQDLADLEMTESGLLVYSFPDIQSLPEKSMARRIADVE